MDKIPAHMAKILRLISYDYRNTKKENPDRKSKTQRYIFNTPSKGISTIKSNSVRLYLKINIQTYMVIAPPSNPVISSFPAVFSGGFVSFCGVVGDSTDSLLSVSNDGVWR